jgi:hypothetical protein
VAQISVKVFFPKPSGNEPPPDNPFELTAVTRHANTQTPARGALEALLGNTTLDEQTAGYQSLDTSNLSIGELAIVDAHAVVDFYSGGTKTWLGDLSPFTLQQAVVFTLKQFSSVTTVAVKVDGDPNFGSLK